MAHSPLFYRRPDRPDYLKRSRHHDYNRPARYMLTLMKSEPVDALCRIEGDVALKKPDENAPHPVLLRNGSFVEAALGEWMGKYPQIAVIAHIIMPDHVHICVHVHSYLRNGLSRAVANFMGMVSRLRHREYYPGDDEKPMQPFFSKGFNDRIAYSDEIWRRQLQYVDDNPRRYLLKKRFPDFFRTSWKLRLEEREYMAMGNILLLRNPHLEVVRFSRRFTDEYFRQRQLDWERCARNGGVLVSPFIHPKEKEAWTMAVNGGGSLIKICDNGFSRRFSPQGQNFDLMCEGRLLLIAAMDHKTEKSDLTYNRAAELNRLAQEIVCADRIGSGARFRPEKL